LWPGTLVPMNIEVPTKYPLSQDRTFVDMYMSYRPFISYDLGHRTAHAPHKFVTSRLGHWPLLIRVSCITWQISMLLETLSYICVT
jgi:hypothetical protein